MKNYLMIDCPMEKLIPFLRRFVHVPHIAIGKKANSHIHYLGFDSRYALDAALVFARENFCHAEEISRDDVIQRYHADQELSISPHSNFDPLVDRL